MSICTFSFQVRAEQEFVRAFFTPLGTWEVATERKAVAVATAPGGLQTLLVLLPCGQCHGQAHSG
jgi:hypothetical protein